MGQWEWFNKLNTLDRYGGYTVYGYQARSFELIPISQTYSKHYQTHTIKPNAPLNSFVWGKGFLTIVKLIAV